MVETDVFTLFSIIDSFFHRAAKKTTPSQESFQEKVKTKSLLVHAFLGHFGALGRSLTRFKAWVRLINDVKSSLTLNNLAVCVATFGGSE